MKPTSHKSITELAVEVYITHSQSHLADALRKYRFHNALMLGTQDEDGVSYTRATNWHFYPANDTIKSASHTLSRFPKIVIKPTSLDVVKHRQRQFFLSLKDGPSEWLFHVFGRILHHIQDMSTPSHVVPVYHGLSIHDEYESYLDDRWDDIHRNIENSITEINVSQEDSRDDFVDIYNSAAEKLLQDIGDFSFQLKIDGEETNGQLDLMWRPYNGESPGNGSNVPFDISGFGAFGPVGKHYGKTSFTDSVEYDVVDDVYMDVASMFVLSAVNDTVKSLMLFESLVNDRYQDMPFLNQISLYFDANDN